MSHLSRQPTSQQNSTSQGTARIGIYLHVTSHWKNGFYYNHRSEFDPVTSFYCVRLIRWTSANHSPALPFAVITKSTPRCPPKNDPQVCHEQPRIPASAYRMFSSMERCRALNFLCTAGLICFCYPRHISLSNDFPKSKFSKR